ncbi:hypothetical protein C0971_15865 [Bacillus methanolicus]|uniref:YqaI family protein n=1 Tax=Bacillus methanolicus TaxID=1471 RepID=UPI00200EF8BC|nr:hypothetical protein [Bacillus methanolicus]UQD52333.1 hypothetical protein C0971_10150 [Bacillus methanolicus]UQD53330.1 hypothetical protein C0971_15865 [Bacillus methanolicus]
MRDHPVIEQINRTGYPNMIAQPEHNGFDYFGSEILSGDEIVIDENNGEVVLKDNLEEYLSEVYEFRFTTAE